MYFFAAFIVGYSTADDIKKVFFFYIPPVFLHPSCPRHMPVSARSDGPSFFVRTLPNCSVTISLCVCCGMGTYLALCYRSCYVETGYRLSDAVITSPHPHWCLHLDRRTVIWVNTCSFYWSSARSPRINNLFAGEPYCLHERSFLVSVFQLYRASCHQNIPVCHRCGSVDVNCFTYTNTPPSLDVMLTSSSFISSATSFLLRGFPFSAISLRL